MSGTRALRVFTHYSKSYRTWCHYLVTHIENWSSHRDWWTCHHLNPGMWVQSPCSSLKPHWHPSRSVGWTPKLMSLFPSYHIISGSAFLKLSVFGLETLENASYNPLVILIPACSIWQKRLGPNGRDPAPLLVWHYQAPHIALGNWKQEKWFPSF